MRKGVLWLLVIINLGLAATLAWMWLDERARLRSFRWQRPAPIAPALSVEIPKALLPQADTDRQFVAILERPLFAANRQPPQVRPAVPVVDPLADFVLLGVYGGGEFGGALARYGGKTRRLKLQESIGEWKLVSVEARQITLKREDEVRVIPLIELRARSATASPTQPNTGTIPSPPNNAQGSAVTEEVARRQEIEERVRARQRARAEAFERALRAR